MSVASSFGNFERLGNLLMMSSAAEEKFWSNLRSTGYSSLDQQLGGLRPSELVVIASQFDWMLPALNLQMIETVAIKEQRPVLHIRVGHDIRASVGSWLKRKQAYPTWFKNKRNDQVPNLDQMAEILQAPIYMLDAHGYSMNSLAASIDSFAKGSEPLGLIVIEGIDRLDVWRDLPDISLAARWAVVSSELKSIAIQYDCPVVVNSAMQMYGHDGIQIEPALLRHLVHDGALASAADLVLVLESSNDVNLGVPVDLYSVYSRHDLWCRIQLRYEHETDRWLEVIAN